MQPLKSRSLELFLVLQKLTNRDWEPTELFPKIRLGTDAKMLSRLEKFPIYRTITFGGKDTEYEIILNRKKLMDDCKLPIKTSVVLATDPELADEQEIIDFINWLIGP